MRGGAVLEIESGVAVFEDGVRRCEGGVRVRVVEVDQWMILKICTDAW